MELMSTQNVASDPHAIYLAMSVNVRLPGT